jgi:hypothetical protein
VKDLVCSSQRDTGITSKDLKDVRATQRHLDLQEEAAQLNSKGARLQYLAFGRVKSGVVDAIRLLKGHETLSAIRSLEEVEHVPNRRYVVKRTGSTPGAWPAATIYEKKLLSETSDAKNDKLWDVAVAEANSVTKAKAKVFMGQKRKEFDAAGSSPSYRKYGRGQLRPFRGAVQYFEF